MSDAQTGNQIEFYVSKGEQTLGPWTIDEIAARLGRSELAVTDFIYLEGRDEWIPLMECDQLREKLKAKKPAKAPPKQAAAPKADIPKEPEQAIAQGEAEVRESAARPESEALARAFSARKEQTAPTAEDAAEWFVQKGSHRYGPFTYLGVVRALQEKSIYEFDLIWKNGMDQWVRVAEHEAFAPERIRDLKTKTEGETGIFFRRQHARIPFESEVIVHDNRSVWMGKAFEGSAGGSGLVIENATLVPGQVVLLHFESRDGLPAFNALCEIVSKKFQKELKDAKTPVTYGVRFIKLDSAAEPKVQEYFRTKGNEVSRAANS